MANYTFPRYQWDLVFNCFRQGVVNNNTYTEFAQILGFYNTVQGSFDSFLYQDQDDYSTLVNLAGAPQPLGTGDATTVAFPLVRSFGGFIEPVLAYNTITALYLAGVAIPAAGIAAPTNGALTDTAGGALAATTYYVKTTWVSNSGETLASVETNRAVAINRQLNVAAPGSAPAGATGWNVYVSNTAGGGAGAETKQNGGTPIALGVAWVEPTSGLVAGAALPGANTTGWSASVWGSANPGVVTFTGAPKAAVAITADFTYYWPCRFATDTIAFNKFISNMYDGKKLSIMSVKN